VIERLTEAEECVQNSIIGTSIRQCIGHKGMPRKLSCDSDGRSGGDVNRQAARMLECESYIETLETMPCPTTTLVWWLNSLYPYSGRCDRSIVKIAQPS